MSFHEQVFLELIKGCFILASVGFAGFYASKALERFKRSQDVLADVTKSRYQVLLDLFRTLSNFERTAMGRAGKCRTGKLNGDDPEVSRQTTSELNEAEWAAQAQGLFLGPEITAEALRFVHSVQRLAWTYSDRSLDISKQQAEVNDIRGRIIGLLPRLKPLD